jgi:hypothetical protein
MVVAEGELSSNGLWPETGQIDGKPGIHLDELLLDGGLSE